MSEAKEEVPAFPVIDTSPDGRVYTVFNGMSIRQWYAGMALQGLATSLTHEEISKLANGAIYGDTFARAALALAVAMIREGQK